MRTLLLCLLVLVTLSGNGSAQASSISNPAAERRVDWILAQLTLGEKVGLLGGVNIFDVPGLARLGIPQLGTADSPFGVCATGPSTLYVGGIALAATWNSQLAERVGTHLTLHYSAVCNTAAKRLESTFPPDSTTATLRPRILSFS